MVWWPTRRTLDLAIWVLALARSLCCVVGQVDLLLSQWDGRYVKLFLFPFSVFMGRPLHQVTADALPEPLQGKILKS